MKKYITAIFLCLLCVFSAQAQSMNVSGVVIDAETREPVLGASIYMKNTPGVGTVTLDGGRFSINASRGDVMVVQLLGYTTFEHLVTRAEANLEIALVKDTEVMEEVVVTALGSTQRKASVVGAITSVNTDDLKVPATSISNMLGGKVAGVITMQASGEPGKNISEFWIRGIGTFGANQSALVLIDGLEGDLNSIDPADIESFSILKDASATAVYGVRGANGVVLVTTKRGQAGKLQVTARANITYSSLHGKFPEYVGGYEYAKLANEARIVRDMPRLFNDLELELIRYNLDKDLYPNVDWQKEIMKKGSWHQTYYASARGGGDIARYFFSLGASLESAAYKQDKSSKYYTPVGYNTYNYRLNLDINLTKTTQVYIGSEGFLAIRKEPGMANTNLLWDAQAMLTPITIPKRYSTGHFPAFGPGSAYSPYVMLNETGMASNNYYSGQATVAITQDLSLITEGLKLKAQGSYDNATNFYEVRRVLPEMYYALGRSATGELILDRRVEKQPATYARGGLRNPGAGEWQSRKYHLESTLDWQRSFGAHRVSALAYYYMTDYKHSGDAKSAMDAIPHRNQGISGRVTYGYDDTYMIDLNAGYTGSANFRPGQQFGFFPAVALGWVPTQYDVMKEALPWLNFLKIRASYGTVGNDRIADAKRFPYLTIVSDSASVGWGATWLSTPGITEQSIGADNLKWELATKADLGVEGRLLDERLEFTVDFFTDHRDNIYQKRVQIPNYIGLIEAPYGNVGRMKSWGSDGNISWLQNLGKDMSLTLRANYTLSRNNVINWEEVNPKYNYQTLSGYPHYSHRGLLALGLFRDEEDIRNSPTQSFGGKVMPGDIKYKDINGDGIIDTDDRIPLSNNTYPELMYGFGFEFRYKKLTVGVMFKGTGKTDYYHVGQNVERNGQWYHNGMGYVPFHGSDIGNVLTIAADQKNRWTPASYSGDPSTESQDVIFPRLSYGYNANNSQMSTWWHDNMGYLRLQEVTVSYNWKAGFMSKIGLSSIDLQFVGNNLKVWSKSKLWDPENAQLNGAVYPIPTRYSFQMYLNF